MKTLTKKEIIAIKRQVLAFYWLEENLAEKKKKKSILEYSNMLAPISQPDFPPITYYYIKNKPYQALIF